MSAHTFRTAEFVALIRFTAEIPADDGLADDWADRTSESLRVAVNGLYLNGVYDESTRVVDIDEVIEVGSDE